MTEIYIPRMTDAINAFEAGRQGSLDRQKAQAAQMIGGAMARGDYRAAADAAYGSGDYQIGSQIERVGDERQSRERRKAYGAKVAAGDLTGAAKDALGDGELEYYSQVEKIQDAQKLQKAKQFGGILRSIASEPEDAWDDRIAENRQALEALDIPPQEIDFFIQASPDQRRVLMSTMLSRADMLDSYLDDRREDKKFASQEADRKADNARADRQVGIAAGHLQQRRAEHEARKEGKGGYGVPGSSPYVPDDDVEIDP